MSDSTAVWVPLRVSRQVHSRHQLLESHGSKRRIGDTIHCLAVFAAAVDAVRVASCLARQHCGAAEFNPEVSQFRPAVICTGALRQAQPPTRNNKARCDDLPLQNRAEPWLAAATNVALNRRRVASRQYECGFRCRCARRLSAPVTTNALGARTAPQRAHCNASLTSATPSTATALDIVIATRVQHDRSRRQSQSLHVFQVRSDR
jgi:hypothetical protein